MYHLSLEHLYTFGACEQYTHQFLKNYTREKPTFFNKISFYGDCFIDYIWTITEEASSKLISVSKDINFTPSWTDSTIILANFDEQIHGGSIVSLTENVENWIIYKRKKGASKLDYITKIPVQSNFLIDYNVANQTEYEYIVFPETLNTIGAPMTSELIKTNWWNWSITNIIPSKNTKNLYYVDLNNIWLFDLDIESSEIQHNIDKKIVETMGKYPKVSIGETDYLSSSLNCYLGKIKNNVYLDDAVMQENFRNFVKDGELKILKDRKGNSFVIDIISDNMTVIDYLEEQPTKISIQWVQLDTLDGYSIVEDK